MTSGSLSGSILPCLSDAKLNANSAQLFLRDPPIFADNFGTDSTRH
jgi:hypothetical protein